VASFEHMPPEALDVYWELSFAGRFDEAGAIYEKYWRAEGVKTATSMAAWGLKEPIIIICGCGTEFRMPPGRSEVDCPGCGQLWRRRVHGDPLE